MLVTTFRDAQGRIKRQAARFQVFVYDEVSPEGRPLKIGDEVEARQPRHADGYSLAVYLANKKACWYQFDTTLASMVIRQIIPAATPALLSAAG